MEHKWYALRVRSNAEQTSATYLQSIGRNIFLPTYRERRQWSDRVKEVRIPLFRGYVFCSMDINDRLPVLQAPGIVEVVGFGKEFVPVPDSEIEAVRKIVNSPAFARPYPFLTAGTHVQLKRGPLAGVEGILVEAKAEYRLVVSVTLLQRSVAVEVDADWVQPASRYVPMVQPPACVPANALNRA
jgi:transcription antitermination factor NusG